MPALLESLNPATGEGVGAVPIASPEAVEAAVAAARAALPAWRDAGPKGRRARLLAWREAIRSERDALARLISAETGKPLADALAEVFAACEFLAYNAHHAPRWLADERLWDFNPLLRNARTVLRRVPKGVVGVISPWNFPLLLSMASISAALAAGNTVVHKPSEFTPLIAEQLGRLAARAGLDAGVLAVVHGPGTVGAALSRAALDHVCFTGSVATGRQVAVACAERLIGCTLELGGNDPALVLPSADLDFTARGLVWGAFSNAGQVCASVERVYVLAEQAPELIARLVARTRALRVGSGAEPGAEVGPIIHEGQRAKIEAQVQQAVAQGAQILAGGDRLSGPGTFFAPTLLSEVSPETAVMRDETFGPVLPIVTVGSIDEMVERANATEYGLSASVWGGDLAQAEAIARRLEAGTVWVNTGLDSYANPMMPRSGWKHSGLGRVGGREGFWELTRTQLLDINRSGRVRLGWFPASGGFYELVSAAMDALHGTRWGLRARGALRLLTSRGGAPEGVHQVRRGLGEDAAPLDGDRAV